MGWDSGRGQHGGRRSEARTEADDFGALAVRKRRHTIGQRATSVVIRKRHFMVAQANGEISDDLQQRPRDEADANSSAGRVGRGTSDNRPTGRDPSRGQLCNMWLWRDCHTIQWNLCDLCLDRPQLVMLTPAQPEAPLHRCTCAINALFYCLPTFPDIQDIRLAKLAMHSLQLQTLCVTASQCRVG